MKRTFFLFSVAAALVLTSCGNETDQQKTDSVPGGSTASIGPAPTTDSSAAVTDNGSAASSGSVSASSTEDTTTACFYLDKGQEHKRVYMMRTGDNVMGDYQINWDEKDGAKGSFFGKFSGDTIWAVYHSIIEGIKMQQEIVFIVKDDKLMVGEGELNSDVTPEAFVNKKKITFDKQRALTKGSCF